MDIGTIISSRLIGSASCPSADSGRSRAPSSISDFLDHSFFITIDEKREAVFRKRFEKYLGGVPRKFVGFSNRDLSGRYNLMLGHAAIVKMAQSLGWEQVAIFEDDALPSRDVMYRLSAVMNSVPVDATMLWLGWARNKTSGGKYVNEHLEVSDRSYLQGSHAWVIYKRGYTFFLDRCKKQGHVDISMGGIERVYYVRYPLFIQASRPSMNNHPGYCGWNGMNLKAPMKGFDHDNDTYEFLSADRKDSIRKIADDVGFHPNHSNCLIIGNDPNALDGFRGRFVDRFDGDVIRVNHLPRPEYSSFYGKRTDVIFGSVCAHEKLWSAKENEFPNKVIVDDMSRVGKWFSSNGKGTVSAESCCMTMALELYDNVHVIGFGSHLCTRSKFVDIHHPSITNVYHDFLEESNKVHGLCFTLGGKLVNLTRGEPVSVCVCVIFLGGKKYDLKCIDEWIASAYRNYMPECNRNFFILTDVKDAKIIESKYNDVVVIEGNEKYFHNKYMGDIDMFRCINAMMGSFPKTCRYVSFVDGGIRFRRVVPFLEIVHDESADVAVFSLDNKKVFTDGMLPIHSEHFSYLGEKLNYISSKMFFASFGIMRELCEDIEAILKSDCSRSDSHQIGKQTAISGFDNYFNYYVYMILSNIKRCKMSINKEELFEAVCVR